VRLAHKNFLNK